MSEPGTQAGRDLLATHNGYASPGDPDAYFGWVEHSYEDTLLWILAIEAEAVASALTALLSEVSGVDDWSAADCIGRVKLAAEAAVTTSVTTERPPD